ncbi:MAG: hypothetical protein IJ088_02810 [Clostridia bacterium]|nr:hypothetical protein [Clostridia bacterium]
MNTTSSPFPQGTVVGDSLSGSPELSARGNVTAGCRTFSFIRPAVPSLAGGLSELPFPLSERIIAYTVWYPAMPEPGETCVYTDYMGRIDLGNLKSFDFPGRARKGGTPDLSMGPRPVVVLTHGYPGSMMLLANLAENLSSKGYVIFSIAHTDNTYTDFIPEGAFESALIHRTMDQRAMLDELTRVNETGPLAGLLDLDRIAMIGFSMGGYGLLRTLGAKFSAEQLEKFSAISEYLTEPDWSGDSRLRAAVLFAPATSYIDSVSLENLRAPTLWFCGTMDRTVGYRAVHDAWTKAVHSRRTMVSYIGCGHNVANNPAPACALNADWSLLKRWADPVWDTARLNTLNFHFITAFLGTTLLDEDSEHYYAGLTEGAPLPGFTADTDVGVRVEHLNEQ